MSTPSHPYPTPDPLERGHLAELPEVDPAEMDLDAWIEGIPTERTITLHRPNPSLEQQLESLETAIAALPEDEDPDGERGITDGNATVLAARLESLKELRNRDRVLVRVRELNEDEIKAARNAYDASGGDPNDNEMRGYWVVSEATVAPHFTPEQLHALSRKGRTGAQMISDLIEATVSQWVLPTVPTSPGSSTSPAGARGSGS